MDTRVLYITAIVIASVSSGYYYFSGKGSKLNADSARSMTYSAKQIELTQTDEKGQLSVRAQIDQLEQDMQNKTTKLMNLNASMFSNNVVNSTFFAKQANGYDDNTKVILSQDVTATKLMQNGKLQFQTEELIVYPKTRDIETDKVVKVESPQAEFVSQGLKANLNEGQYEFLNIRGKYEPNS